MYDKTKIEALKPHIIAYLRQRGLDVSGHKCFSCLNPLHEDKHPSMAFNPNKLYVHCFACGKTYDIFDLIGMECRLSSFPEQVAEVQRRYANCSLHGRGGDFYER